MYFDDIVIFFANQLGDMGVFTQNFGTFWRLLTFPIGQGNGIDLGFLAPFLRDANLVFTIGIR